MLTTLNNSVKLCQTTGMICKPILSSPIPGDSQETEPRMDTMDKTGFSLTIPLTPVTLQLIIISQPEFPNGSNLQFQKSTRLLIPLLTSSHTSKETTLGTMPSTTNPMKLSSWITLRLFTLIISRISPLQPNITLEKEEPVLPLRMKSEEIDISI